ncbi:unnamed protein product [Pleuronectes platessa]|uniref:Secreted protein n=1 Tax=Pleuronectes platessa TaxID=8262 RepID=A0A9N7Y690_PLEPL|nr:unnamed protein product [Pleuronectes platessa]
MSCLITVVLMTRPSSLLTLGLTLSIHFAAGKQQCAVTVVVQYYTVDHLCSTAQSQLLIGSLYYGCEIREVDTHIDWSVTVRLAIASTDRSPANDGGTKCKVLCRQQLNIGPAV